MAIFLNNSIIYFDETRQVVFKIYHSPFTLYDLTTSWELAFQNNSIPLCHHGFIIDCRLGSNLIPVSQIKEITSFYDSYPEYFKGTKMAVISNKPNDYVIPMLIGQKKPEYRSKTFSTMESAVEWIINGGGYLFLGLNFCSTVFW